MSSALELLQGIKQYSKPYKGYSKLPVGAYEVLSFRLVNNKNYDKRNHNSPKKTIIVEIDDQVLFLPDYFVLALKEDEKKVQELNTDGVRKYLFFGGVRPNK